MPNPKGNTSTLKFYTSKWNSGKTQTIRVPIALVNEIMEYAHKLDSSKIKTLSQVNNGKSSEQNSEEDEEVDEDNSEDEDTRTNEEVIKSQANRIQRLLIDVKILEEDLEKSKELIPVATLSQVIQAIKDICLVPNTSKFTNGMRNKLMKEALEPLKLIVKEFHRLI